MKIQLLFFGVTTDLVGENSIVFELKEEISIEYFKKVLIDAFPKLKNIDEFAIAINEAYANDTSIIKENDVVAIIPPVSGG